MTLTNKQILSKYKKVKKELLHEFKTAKVVVPTTISSAALRFVNVELTNEGQINGYQGKVIFGRVGNTQVACKTLFQQDTSNVDLILNEAAKQEIVGAIVDPYMPKLVPIVLGLFRHDQELYFVMERCSGVTMAEFKPDNGKQVLDIIHAYILFTKISLWHGFNHSDLHTKNVMTSEEYASDSRIKVLDFGSFKCSTAMDFKELFGMVFATVLNAQTTGLMTGKEGVVAEKIMLILQQTSGDSKKCSDILEAISGSKYDTIEISGQYTQFNGVLYYVTRKRSVFNKNLTTFILRPVVNKKDRPLTLKRLQTSFINLD